MSVYFERGFATKKWHLTLNLISYGRDLFTCRLFAFFYENLQFECNTEH